MEFLGMKTEGIQMNYRQKDIYSSIKLLHWLILMF